MAFSKRGPYKKKVVVKAPRVIRSWSQYQLDIFKDISSGHGNTQVDAYAGTGKTATIVEGFYHIPAGKSVLMCAFNKSIQEELESRAPEGVTIKTLHSLGYAAIRRAFPRIGAPDMRKLEGFIKAELGDEPETNDFREQLENCISLCKGYLAKNTEDVEQVMDRHGIECDESDRSKFIELTLKIMEATKQDTARIDFDDMIWFPNVHNLTLEKFDMVFIDEAQDLNLAQINLALNSVKSGGRVISVGDCNQAIYSFRGADSNAIQNIVDRMHSKRMPLSVTYRCAKKIVELAQTLVPGLEASPDAKEGLVEEITTDKMEELVQPGDFILSRINQPLVKWCLALLKIGKRANIQGRDLGKSLMYWIKKSKAESVNGFLEWLSDYQEMETERLVKSRKDPATLNDKVECVRTLCDGMKTLDDVKENINRLFKDGDDKDRVILSSIHKSKGLERERVFLLRDTCKPSKGQEEKNLYYVGITRAKSELYLVSGR